MIAGVIAILVFLGFQTVSAGDLKEMAGPDLLVRYDAALEYAAAGVMREFPVLKRETEDRLGWRFDAAPTLVLLRGGKEFRSYVDNDLTTAFAVPGKNLIVIDYSKMEKNPFELRATLKHELTHLLLNSGASPRFPKWFDEGVAQWASGGIGDIMNPGREDVLKRAVLSGNLLALREIAGTFPGDPSRLLLAYQEGKSFVEYLTKEHGEAKLRALLNDVRNGKDFEQAMGDTLSADLAETERKWRRHLVRQYSWAAYVADHIEWLLFLFAAIATVAGYLQIKRRMRRYRDEEDEDENHSDGGGPPPAL